MAARVEATRHQQTRTQQPPQQQQQQRSTPVAKPHVYTLYPDLPTWRASTALALQMPPSPSQLLPKHQESKSKTTYADLTPQSPVTSTKSPSSPLANGQVSGRSQNTQPTITTRTTGQNTKQQQSLWSPQNRSQQQSYTPSSRNVLPSPISPSSPASMGYVAPNKSTVRLEEAASPTTPQGDRTQKAVNGSNGVRYDQAQYQQSRQQPVSNVAVQHDVASASKSSGSTAATTPAQSSRLYGHQQQPSYGGSVPRTASVNKLGQGEGQGQAIGYGTALKQALAPGSTSSAPSGTASSQHKNGMKQNASSPTSPTSPRQGLSAASPPRPSIVTDIPSSSLYLSFDRERESGPQHSSPDREKIHQQQALQYQKKLQQKPPSKQGGEDTDDDSDTGSILSYQRSIHRLSMTYNGRPGVPNISLFKPHQRTANGGSNTQPGKGMKDPRTQQLQQAVAGKNSTTQQQQQQQQQGSASSLASIDQHRHQKNQQGSKPRQDDDDRPRVVRAYTTNDAAAPRSKEAQVPERSISADNIYNDNGSRSRQQAQPSQNQLHWKQHPYPSNHLPYQSGRGDSKSPTPPSAGGQRSNYNDPRPSHESARGTQPQYSRSKADAQQQGRNGGAAGQGGSFNPSRSLSPNGGANGGGVGPSRSPPTAMRGGGGAGPGGKSNKKVNMHPAHHLPSGGYVRPEEAVGPSNPMPERAEDYVRQGIEFHESGDISKATHYFRTAAELGDPVGMLMYGLSVRHGWGCTANRVLAFQYLQKSAEHAVGDLNSRDSFTSTAAKGELVLSIYELGICFRHGWGTDKNKKTAAYYFEIAANLGDPDAQNDLAWCYYHGVGVKKDMYKSAKYYRLAAAQGLEIMGNSWIWKDKYGGPTSPMPVDKHSHRHLLQAF